MRIFSVFCRVLLYVATILFLLLDTLILTAMTMNHIPYRVMVIISLAAIPAGLVLYSLLKNKFIGMGLMLVGAVIHVVAGSLIVPLLYGSQDSLVPVDEFRGNMFRVQYLTALIVPALAAVHFFVSKKAGKGDKEWLDEHINKEDSILFKKDDDYKMKTHDR